jgi:hypothetical protein
MSGMKLYRQSYVDGRWVDPLESRAFDLVDAATKTVYARGRQVRRASGCRCSARREIGSFGLEEYLEMKALIGLGACAVQAGTGETK